MFKIVLTSCRMSSNPPSYNISDGSKLLLLNHEGFKKDGICERVGSTIPLLSEQLEKEEGKRRK